MTDQPSHVVPLGPTGLIIALQYWAGDEVRAMRLARLMADLEPRPREDVTIMFASRFDVSPSPLVAETADYVSRKFPVTAVRSEREGTGHPDGCNALVGGLMDKLVVRWFAGDLLRSSVFLAEADGGPLRADWLDVLIEEHARTLHDGRAITGPYMGFWPHVNGTMMIHVPWWADHPSVHYTPRGHGWDVFHREAILRAARPTTTIMNIHGSTGWSSLQLRPLSQEVAWLTSVKDDSVIHWAETELLPRSRLEREAGEQVKYAGPLRCTRCGRT